MKSRKNPIVVFSFIVIFIILIIYHKNKTNNISNKHNKSLLTISKIEKYSKEEALNKTTISTRTTTTTTTITAKYNLNMDKTRFLIESECICKEENNICLKLNSNDTYTISITQNRNQSKQYVMDKEEFEYSNMTCDPFNVLRRGMHQKVISYSIYNDENEYNNFDKNHLISLMKSAKKYFPDWVIRIYHNGTISKSDICELECLADEKTNTLFDNVDFCDINRLTFESMDIKHLTPSFWRWLTVGDAFVDIFLSRDFDSCIGEREFLAVDEWLKENTLFHIMRGDLFVKRF